ncbi:unnamed protein product, partial [Discosporangium mesarthrocarpum]
PKTRPTLWPVHRPPLSGMPPKSVKKRGRDRVEEEDEVVSAPKRSKSVKALAKRKSSGAQSDAVGLTNTGESVLSRSIDDESKDHDDMEVDGNSVTNESEVNEEKTEERPVTTETQPTESMGEDLEEENEEDEPTQGRSKRYRQEVMQGGPALTTATQGQPQPVVPQPRLLPRRSADNTPQAHANGMHKRRPGTQPASHKLPAPTPTERTAIPASLPATVGPVVGARTGAGVTAARGGGGVTASDPLASRMPPPPTNAARQQVLSRDLAAASPGGVSPLRIRQIAQSGPGGTPVGTPLPSTAKDNDGESSGQVSTMPTPFTGKRPRPRGNWQHGA